MPSAGSRKPKRKQAPKATEPQSAAEAIDAITEPTISSQITDVSDATTAAESHMAPQLSNEVAETVTAAESAPTPGTPATGSLFLNRVSSLPIVTSAVDQARQLYASGKARYPSLSNIEASVVTHVLPAVLSASKPIVSAYDARLHQIDSLACTGLDALEQRLPLIKQNPDEILEASKALLPKPAIPSVADVQTALRSTLERARTTVEHGIDGALHNAESAVDRLLPAEDLDENNLDNMPVVDMDDVAAGKTKLRRVTELGSSVRSRLSTRLVKQLNAIQLRSPAQLREMKFTVDLIQYAQQSLEHQAAWLKESLAAPAVATPVESLRSAAHRAAAAAHSASDATVSAVSAVLSHIKEYVPAGVSSRSAELRDRLAKRVADLKALAQRDDAYVKRAAQLAEDGAAYLRDVQKTLREYYSSAVGIVRVPAGSLTDERAEAAAAVAAAEPLANNAEPLVNGDIAH